MTLLLGYLRDYRKLVVLALGLAAINQIFSLLDPLIFRHVIDEYATRYREYSTEEFFRGVGLLLAAAVGVAFVSRVAKNFQDYFINVITQRLGARLYADGIRHSLALPYQVFEDQRSGETLGILQKARADVEKLISQSINLLFTTLVGIIFVMIYAFYVHWIIAPDLPGDGAPARPAQLGAEPADQESADRDRQGDHGAGRFDDRVAAQHRAGQEPGPGPAGSGAAQQHHRSDPAARAEESALPPQPEFRAGHLRQRASDEHPVPDALPDLQAGDHGRASSSRCSSTRSSSSGRCRSWATSSTRTARRRPRWAASSRSCRRQSSQSPRTPCRSMTCSAWRSRACGSRIRPRRRQPWRA